jgi:hypothetical protein
LISLRCLAIHASLFFQFFLRQIGADEFLLIQQLEAILELDSNRLLKFKLEYMSLCLFGKKALLRWEQLIQEMRNGWFKWGDILEESKEASEGNRPPSDEDRNLRARITLAPKLSISQVLLTPSPSKKNMDDSWKDAHIVNGFDASLVVSPRTTCVVFVDGK